MVLYPSYFIFIIPYTNNSFKLFNSYTEKRGASKRTLTLTTLLDRGYAISESTVAKIMHQNGLFSIRACAKTLYKQQMERKNNILQQQFHVSRPNEVWVSDVTYFSVFNRMYYICVIIDLYARKVIAHKITKHNKQYAAYKGDRKNGL